MQARSEPASQRLDYIRVDSSVLMKITRHARDGLKPNGCGQLLGSFEQTYIEASDCFPLLFNEESLSDVRFGHPESHG
jgi:hypothetical protein